MSFSSIGTSFSYKARWEVRLLVQDPLAMLVTYQSFCGGEESTNYWLLIKNEMLG